MTQMAGAMAGRQIIAQVLVEGQQTDAVALQVKEVGESAGQSVSILRFGVGKRAVAHRAAVIDQQMAAKVGFVLKLFDIIAVSAGVEPPVQVARVVAGAVLAILGELDGEAVIRTGVEAVPESFHNDFGAQLEVFDGHQGERIDQRGAAGAGTG